MHAAQTELQPQGPRTARPTRSQQAANWCAQQRRQARAAQAAAAAAAAQQPSSPAHPWRQCAVPWWPSAARQCACPPAGGWGRRSAPPPCCRQQRGCGPGPARMPQQSPSLPAAWVRACGASSGPGALSAKDNGAQESRQRLPAVLNRVSTDGSTMAAGTAVLGSANLPSTRSGRKEGRRRSAAAAMHAAACTPCSASEGSIGNLAALQPLRASSLALRGMLRTVAAAPSAAAAAAAPAGRPQRCALWRVHPPCCAAISCVSGTRNVMQGACWPSAGSKGTDWRATARAAVAPRPGWAPATPLRAAILLSGFRSPDGARCRGMRQRRAATSC